MKLVFLRTRDGKHVANNGVTTYLIEEYKGKYKISSPYFFIEEQFDTISNAEKYCQEIENEVFDKDAINTALKKAIEHLGGIDKFYNFIADKETTIVLREDCATFVKTQSRIVFWNHSREMICRFSYEIATVKYPTIKYGLDIKNLISEELLHNEVYLFPTEETGEKSDE